MFDVAFLHRLAHYAFAYVPGPKWNEKEAAARAKQAHLDGVTIEMLTAMMGVREYSPGEYCKAIRCAHYNDGRFDDDWCDNKCGAYAYFLWLRNHGYRILKDRDEQI